MSEPTIDEMLEGLESLRVDLAAEYGSTEDEDRIFNAIRAILERHEAIRTKLMLLETAENFQKLEAIRAFVEQVNARWLQNAHVKNYDFRFYVCEELEAMQMDELAAMEKENERTND